MKAGLEKKLVKLREKFAQQLPDRIGDIENRLKELEQEQWDINSLNALKRSVHTLAGSASTFGYTRLGATASSLERLIKQALNDIVDREGFMDNLKKEVQTLKNFYSGMDPLDHRVSEKLDNFYEPDKPELPARVATEGKRLGKKNIFIVDDDKLQIESLADPIKQAGYNVFGFTTLSEMEQAVKENPPSVVIMDVIFSDTDMSGPKAISLLKEGNKLDVPVIYISHSNKIEDRLDAVRSQGNAYLLKPINTELLVKKVHDLTTNKKAEPYRILIIDDEPDVADYYSTVLSHNGMNTSIEHDPLRVLDRLETFRPDLILMDMYMPACSGQELAGAIRQLDEYINIPIVFLSGESDISKQLHAMSHGADDFLQKSISTEHLISSVTIRAERMRIVSRLNELKDHNVELERKVLERTAELNEKNSVLGDLNRELQKMATTDFLTSAFNRAKFNQVVNADVDRFNRYHIMISIILFDIDHFKKINDTCGHEMGDYVLKETVSIIQRNLRKCDVLARWGGEEFIILLPETSLDDASKAAEKLRLIVENYEFPCASQVTISFGLSQIREGDNSKTLIKRADDALYNAKRTGRNKVVALR